MHHHALGAFGLLGLGWLAYLTFSSPDLPAPDSQLASVVSASGHDRRVPEGRNTVMPRAKGLQPGALFLKDAMHSIGQAEEPGDIFSLHRIANWLYADNPEIYSALKQTLSSSDEEDLFPRNISQDISFSAQQMKPRVKQHIPSLITSRSDLEEAFHKQPTLVAYPLAYALELGIGGPMDTQRAIKLYQWAARNGDARAQCRLGILHMKGQLGFSQNKELAEKWLTRAAVQSDLSAQYHLGWLLLNGNRAEKLEGVTWIMASANGGYEPARSLLKDVWVQLSDADKKAVLSRTATLPGVS